MKNKEAMFTSNSDEWNTPQDLFDTLNKEFEFALDAAASKDNSKTIYYLKKNSEVDALTTNWYESLSKIWKWKGNKNVWLNPPYSQNKAFMKKAYEESEKGLTVVCLIPSRTDTKYWHDYVMKASEIRFIKGRLKFSDSKNSAPFPSCIVIFSEHDNETPLISSIDKKGGIYL